MPQMPTRSLVLAAGYAICTFARAQTPEIVVTSTAAPSSALTAPAQQISGDALLMRQASSLGETLLGLPGVSSSYFGATASRPMIRGLDGDRVRILDNGATASDASGLSFDHAVSSSPLGAERIEIVRGPASLLYSGSAAGGTVNLLDNRIAKVAAFDKAGGILGKAQTSVDTGSRGRDAAALLETGTDQFALHVDAFARKNSEMNAPLALRCTQLGFTRVQNKICNSQADALGGALGASLFLDHGYVGASLQSTQQNYGSPAEANVGIQMRNLRSRVEGETRALGTLSRLVQSLSGYVVQHSYQHQELDTGTATTSFKSKGVNSQLQARLQDLPFGKQKLGTVIGWQQEHIDFVAEGTEAFVPHSTAQSQALYALQEAAAPWGKLSASVRGMRAQINSQGLAGNPSFTPTQRRFSGTSYALGGLFALDPLTPGLSATFDASHSARIPKDYELYANGVHAATGAYEIGNANLAVEKSTHLELGMHWQGEQKTERTHLNLYTTRYDNYIYLQATGAVSGGGLPIYQYSVTAANFRGWEWTGATRLMTANSQQPRSLDVEVRLDSVTAINAATGTPLPRIAPQRLGLDWIGKQAAWTARLGVDHYAAQNQVAALQPPTASYSLWNAALTYEEKLASGRWLWFAKLNNATNRLAYPATSILTQTVPGQVPLPGRSLKLGVQLSF